MAKQKKLTKPSTEDLAALRAKDEGFQEASRDAVAFLKGRRQAAFNIARHYHLDPDELFQEAYEVLLTCLRDFTPIYEKKDGDIVSVQFTTFFGNRLENRAMELRNRDPEYQARQAMTDGMSTEERERFRSDPPLLVQHLDHESAMQENLRGEVSEARRTGKEDLQYRIARDSFFDRKLAELVAKEKDEKKQAALLHVKVGGVYNFQEIAYHFGVTDSRASQVMNELMDAFYVQRMIDRDIEGVAYDFVKLKFNEKRVMRLLEDALKNVDGKRAQAIVEAFEPNFSKVKDLAKKIAQAKPADSAPVEEDTEVEVDHTPSDELAPPSYEEVFTEKENKAYPLLEVGLRPISSLQALELEFRPTETDESFKAFVEAFDVNSPLYPAVVSEDGRIIDGERRIRAAKARGRTDYLCLTRRIGDEFDKKLLRVVVNMRLHNSSKIEMYYAIKALSALGLSQQKIADHLGTSRTNVLVYCKVRDKASPYLRALFEDGLVQITNAATCVDLPDDIQRQLVEFIRRHGRTWSKGSKFNKLYEAAVDNAIDKLEAQVSPVAKPAQTYVSGHSGGDTKVDPAAKGKIEALQKQVEAYATALKDAEIWASQREGVINSQREQLGNLKAETEGLRRELEAAELMQFGSSKAIEQELKQLKQFYAITERLAGATHALDAVVNDLSRADLRRKQALELMNMMEVLEKALNAFRVELLNRSQQLGLSRRVG